jgi:hypothetical protein
MTLCPLRFVSIDQDPFGWMVSLLNLCGFPQTRRFHWLAARDREFSHTNAAMLALSPLMLLIGFVVRACELDGWQRRLHGRTRGQMTGSADRPTSITMAWWPPSCNAPAD